MGKYTYINDARIDGTNEMQLGVIRVGFGCAGGGVLLLGRCPGRGIALKRSIVQSE